MTIAWWIAPVAALVIGLVVVVIELRSSEIPNALTLPTLFIGLAFGLVDRHVGDHIGGAVVAVLVTSALYRQDLIGGGGLKWTVAVSALLGFRLATLMILVAAAIALVCFGIAKLRRRGMYVATSPLVLIGTIACIANVFLRDRIH